MTRDEIDNMLDLMAKEAAEKGDDSLLPGAITFNSATWVKRTLTDFPTTCASVKDGIRYRNIQVLISGQREDGVLSRAEVGESGEEFRDLTPKA